MENFDQKVPKNVIFCKFDYFTLTLISCSPKESSSITTCVKDMGNLHVLVYDPKASKTTFNWPQLVALVFLSNWPLVWKLSFKPHCSSQGFYKGRTVDLFEKKNIIVLFACHVVSWYDVVIFIWIVFFSIACLLVSSINLIHRMLD